MNKRLRLILVLLFYALMFTYAVLNAYQTFTFPRSNPGWIAQGRNGRARVKQVSSEVASALQSGDEVLAINGQPLREIPLAPTSQPLKRLVRLEPGTPYTITVNREGQTYLFTLRTGVFKASNWLLTGALSLLLPATCLSVGLIIFLLKPYDKQALLLALMLAAFIPPTAAGWIDNLPPFVQAIMVTGGFCTVFAAPLLAHFFLIFPEPSPFLRRFPRLEWLLYLPTLLFFAPLTIIVMLWEVGSPLAQKFQVPSGALVARGVLVVLYLACAVLSLSLNYRRAGEVAKRKMRVVVAGMVAGFFPALFFFFLIGGLFDIGKISPALADWLPFVAALALPIMPVSLAYAIWRHQVIPVSLMIRRSIQYLLAKNALRILLALPLVGLTLSIIANRDRPLTDILLRNSFYFYLLLLAAIAVGLFFRKRLEEWIDRKFFRESYNQEKILRELIEDVKKLDSIPEMSKRVTEQVSRALHPEQVYLFYRAEDARALSLSYTSGGASEEMRIPEDFGLLRFMEFQGVAQDFPFPQKNNLPSVEKEWLAQLGTRLIVPMTGTDTRLAGLFLLGEKKSEVPYTASDRELLEALAAQIAIVYENVQLKERVERERKIKTEIVARFEGQSINLLKECPACGACFDATIQTCPHDRNELALTLPVERSIEGRYRLDRLLGRGGMGAVYEATDLRLSRRVAVKILTGSAFGKPEALRRFEREAQASARLNHQNIITVFDYGVLQTEGAYLVMELLEGETLRAYLKRQGFISPQTASLWFNQVLEAMKAAHQAGIIHRDLKPENVFIERGANPQIKILDFGLAKLAETAPVSPDDPTVPPVTTPGVVMGTFGYMSPEQLTGDRVDERSDIFSAGVMVVEALTGRRPFTGKTYTELLTNILHGSFHLPSDSDESRRLDEVLQRCLAKDRTARFSSAAEMQYALIPALRDCPTISSHDKSTPEADTIILKR